MPSNDTGFICSCNTRIETKEDVDAHDKSWFDLGHDRQCRYPGCKTVSPQTSNAKRHLRIHFPDHLRFYFCQKCGIRYAKPQALRLHEAAVECRKNRKRTRSVSEDDPALPIPSIALRHKRPMSGRHAAEPRDSSGVPSNETSQSSDTSTPPGELVCRGTFPANRGCGRRFASEDALEGHPEFCTKPLLSERDQGAAKRREVWQAHDAAGISTLQSSAGPLIVLEPFSTDPGAVRKLDVQSLLKPAEEGWRPPLFSHTSNPVFSYQHNGYARSAGVMTKPFWSDETSSVIGSDLSAELDSGFFSAKRPPPDEGAYNDFGANDLGTHPLSDQWRNNTSSLRPIRERSTNVPTTAPLDPRYFHPIQRPDDTRVNVGTYTCTYHGCTQRFMSHLSLQRHERDSHRSHAHNNKDSGAESGAASVSQSSNARFTTYPVLFDNIDEARVKRAAALLARNPATAFTIDRFQGFHLEPFRMLYSSQGPLTLFVTFSGLWDSEKSLLHDFMEITRFSPDQPRLRHLWGAIMKAMPTGPPGMLEAVSDTHRALNRGASVWEFSMWVGGGGVGTWRGSPIAPSSVPELNSITVGSQICP